MSHHHPQATRDHHETFCVTERWQVVTNARGKAVSHHVTYEFALHDGRILRTRISRPVDRTTYGKSIWGAILRDQLEVSAQQFWHCVVDARVPERGFSPTALSSSTQSLPLQLVLQLTRTVGLSEGSVASMSKAEAIEALNEYWLAASTEQED